MCMDWGSVFCPSPFHVRFGLIRLRCIFLIQATKLVITDLICDLPRKMYTNGFPFNG